MTKWFRVGFTIAVIFFLFRQIPLFANEFNPEDNFLKICAELSNGKTDFKKHIGEKISFNYIRGTNKTNINGSVTFEKFQPSSSTYGTKVLILNPFNYPFVSPIDECSTTGTIKAVDVADKTIILDKANVCYTSANLM